MQPRAFVSYSWTSSEHVEWVLDLAKELVQSGIEVKVDRWDLREGQDKYHFMETMVTDQSITKVIVVADAEYARKADSRLGGVGTETQIVSKKVYDSVDQNKFVAVVKEFAADGQPCLPTFFKTRIYIDMSDEPKRRDNFEQLVRWLYDKPQFAKPPLGRPPDYITSSTISLGTTSRARHATSVIRAGATNASGSLRDYLDTFAGALIKSDFAITAHEIPGDAMCEALGHLLAVRDEFVEVAFNVARYQEHQSALTPLADFFEILLSDPAFCGAAIRDERADTFRFLTYELVLYTIAAALKHRRFQEVRALFKREYLLPKSTSRPGGLRQFTVLQRRPESLTERGERIRQKPIYLVANLLKQRATRVDISFANIAEADFVAFLYCRVNGLDQWRPHAALLVPHSEPFPLFERAASRATFVELGELLGVSTADELRQRIRQSADAQWSNYWELDISDLIDEEYLASRN